MKNTRLGMGKGRGIGYYNIAPLDSHIHSLSAKGIKSQCCILQAKKGITDYKSANMHTVDVKSYNEKEVAEASKRLAKYFKDFQDKNKQFNFQGSVTDKDGNRAYFLVDFGIEDNKEDFYYVASIGGTTKDGKPFDDWTNVEAFEIASEIVDSAIESGLDYQQREIEWDTGGTDHYVPKKGKFDATKPVIWRDERKLDAKGTLKWHKQDITYLQDAQSHSLTRHMPYDKKRVAMVNIHKRNVPFEGEKYFVDGGVAEMKPIGLAKDIVTTKVLRHRFFSYKNKKPAKKKFAQLKKEYQKIV